MTGPRPDFSPSMLRLFLTARSFARDAFERRRKANDLADEIIAATGLPYSTVRSAFAGRCPDQAARAAIWRVLGHEAQA